MKNNFFRMKLVRAILLMVLIQIATTVSAVQIKLSLTLVEVASHEAEGFDNSTIATSNFGLKVLTPVAADTLWGLGISRFNARIKDGEKVSPRYEGIISMIMFEAGFEYSGIEIITAYNLVLEVSVEFPISGEGRVVDSSNQVFNRAKSVDGNGIFWRIGVRSGSIEGGLYYKKNVFSLGEMTNPRNPDKEISLDFSSSGLYIAYLF